VAARHRFEESDELRLSVDADSFGEVFEEAARALGELVEDPSGAMEDGDVELMVQAREPAGLLVEWLNEIIGRAEAEGWLATRFRVMEATPERLRVRSRGIPWPSRAFPVKAATLERASLTRTPTGWRGEVTLDV
jgi:SHS2 domain-containing protein